MSQRRGKQTRSTAVQKPDSRLIAVLINEKAHLSERLDAGEQLIAAGRELDLASIVNQMPRKERAENRTDEARIARLHAYAAAHSGALIDAEQSIEQAISRFPQALDMIYLKLFVAISFHEYAKALDLTKQFRAIFGNGESIAGQIPGAFLTGSHLSQIANMAGLSHRALGQIEEAEQEFRTAISLDSSLHLAWLNLLHLLSSTDREAEIPQLVAEARRACPTVTEFAQFLTTDQSAPTVSVCMIVKNEEQLLPEALASVKPFASEIIIVDTGSTDRTKEIALASGAKVIDEPWEGNFSKHRNTSIQHATGDWIFILDADERVEADDVELLKQVLQKTDRRVISINVFNLYGKKRESHNFLPSVRLFRRSLGLRYEGIVHNVLNVPQQEPVLRLNTRLWHLGYDLSPEKMQQKFLRSKALLEAQLAANPNNAFAHFNYAQLLRGASIELQIERSKNIILSASRAVDLTGPEVEHQRHIHLMALNQLAWAYFAIGNHEKSREYLDRALRHKSTYLDPLMLRGHLSSKEEKFEQAIKEYRTFLDAQAAYSPEHETDDIIVANVSNRAAAYYGIALAYHALGNSSEARRFYRETLRENNEYHEANQFLGLLELEAGNEAEGIRYLEAQLRTDEPTVHAAVALATIERERKTLSRALQYSIQAVEIDPKNEAAVQLLVELLVETGRALELPALYEKSRQNGVSSSALDVAEARGWYTLGEYQRCSDLFSKVSSDRLNASDLVKRGNAQLKLGQFESAADSYQSALTAGHQDDTILRNYAIALLKAGKLHQAGTTLRAYLQEPGSDQGMWEILGDIYQKLGEHSLAVDAFESVVKTQKTSRNALLGLCNSYEALGHLSAARLGMQQLSRLYPSDQFIAKKYAELSERCSESEQVH